MRYSSLVPVVAVLLFSTAAAQEPPTVPFDQCGIVQSSFFGGGCWTFNGYEIGGNLGGHGNGDTVRVIGTYMITYSFCMVARCCLVSDSVLLCGTCCNGMTGNADGSLTDEPDVSDLTATVEVLFRGGAAICAAELDVDGSGGTREAFNVSDLTLLVGYLFAGGPAPVDCP